MTLRFIDYKTSEPLPATSRSALSSVSLGSLSKDSRSKDSPRRARGLSWSNGSRIDFQRVDSLAQRRRLRRVLLNIY
jgi:hypothetical protein